MLPILDASYMIYIPDKALTAHISHYTITKLYAGDVTYLPATTTPLIVILKSGKVTSLEEGNRECGVLPSAFLEGPTLFPRWSRADSESEVASVHFRPQALRNFFRMPVSEFVNQRVPLEDVMGRDALMVAERLWQEDNEAHIKHGLDQWLMALRDQTSRVKLLNHDGVSKAIRIGEITKELRMSQRQFERRFLVNFGVSYREWRKLQRAAKVLFGFASGRCEGVDLSDIAVASGYYDQSHMIRDFRQYFGMPPPRLFEKLEHDKAFWTLGSLDSRIFSK